MECLKDVQIYQTKYTATEKEKTISLFYRHALPLFKTMLESSKLEQFLYSLGTFFYQIAFELYGNVLLSMCCCLLCSVE